MYVLNMQYEKNGVTFQHYINTKNKNGALQYRFKEKTQIKHKPTFCFKTRKILHRTNTQLADYRFDFSLCRITPVNQARGNHNSHSRLLKTTPMLQVFFNYYY